MVYTGVRRACLIAAAVVLSSCKDPNPLLGEWVLERTGNISFETYQVAKVTGNGRLRFEADRIVSGQQAVRVLYEVDGEAVTVEYVASGRTATYEVIDGKAFFLEHPVMGRFKYVRVARPKSAKIY